MSEHTNPPLSSDTQAMLDCLRQAVSKTLERKRRLVFGAVDRQSPVRRR